VFLAYEDKVKCLKLKLPAVIEWGEVIVEATYNLEGDGLLSI